MGQKETDQAQGLICRAARALRANRKLEYLVYGGIALLILLLYLSTVLPDGDEATPNPVTLGEANTRADVEERLSAVLGSIRGAGRVEVMVTYESGPELVPAMSTDVDVSTTQSTGSDGRENSVSQQTESAKPATVSGSGGTEPIVLTEREPAVRGVIVVAEGAADIAVKHDLQRAVQTVLDVPLSAIEVFEMARE